MDISIVKVESGPHRAVVSRPGMEAVQFAVYDYGPVLPHDLVHYVVEDELGLQAAAHATVRSTPSRHSVCSSTGSSN